MTSSSLLHQIKSKAIQTLQAKWDITTPMKQKIFKKKKYQENYTFQTTKTILCYVSYYKPRILKSEEIVKKQRQTRGQKIMVHKIINRNIFSCLLFNQISYIYITQFEMFINIISEVLN